MCLGGRSSSLADLLGNFGVCGTNEACIFRCAVSFGRQSFLFSVCPGGSGLSVTLGLFDFSVGFTFGVDELLLFLRLSLGFVGN